MKYKLQPLNDNISVIELKAKEIKEYTGKALADVDSGKMNVLNYGRVVSSSSDKFKAGEVVLFQKLAAHKTSFGVPSELVVPIEHIEAKLEEVK